LGGVGPVGTETITVLQQSALSGNILTIDTTSTFFIFDSSVPSMNIYGIDGGSGGNISGRTITIFCNNSTTTSIFFYNLQTSEAATVSDNLRLIVGQTNQYAELGSYTAISFVYVSALQLSLTGNKWVMISKTGV
jgi:hypothetical protein